jgi:hypothetical protein
MRKQNQTVASGLAGALILAILCSTLMWTSGRLPADSLTHQAGQASSSYGAHHERENPFYAERQADDGDG